VALLDLGDRQAQGLLLVFLNRRNSHLAHLVVRRLGLESRMKCHFTAPEQNTK
jgi:hypothetical protein